MFLNPVTDERAEYSGAETVDDLETLMQAGFEWLILPWQVVCTSEVYAACQAAEECAALD